MDFIGDSTNGIMKIGDKGVDKFCKRLYIGDDHEDYWNCPDRTDHDVKRCRSLSYYWDTSGDFWVLRNYDFGLICTKNKERNYGKRKVIKHFRIDG